MLLFGELLFFVKGGKKIMNLLLNFQMFQFKNSEKNVRDFDEFCQTYNFFRFT